MQSASLLRSLILVGILGTPTASAQIVYDTVGATYTQDFNNTYSTGNHRRDFTPNTDSVNPASTSGSVGWVGWYATTLTGNLSSGTGNSTTTSDIRIADGTSNTNFVLYLFRTSGEEDAALGSAAVDALAGTSGSGGYVTYGMRLVNNTGVTLTEFTLNYTGEQWRVGSNQTNTQSLLVSYQIGGSNLIDGTWTDIPELTFTGPKAQSTSPSEAFSLDGNLPENRLTLGQTVSGITWEPGTELWIRWYDVNDQSVDHGLGIDDISFSAIPEPAAYAGIAGLMVLGAALLRRRLR